jgi:GcrA cell cycle regulator
MEWAEETIFRLRMLWDEGLSTAEIGRRLGVSKNAVVGMRTGSTCRHAHRRSEETARAEVPAGAAPRAGWPGRHCRRSRARPR